jgi:calcineurin-like phosphoesterase family protein
MNDIWFTSDTHFFHKKILEFCPLTRKGANINEMNYLIKEAWNKRVKPGDSVYHLGDFSFGKADETKEFAESLNGVIHLIKGNHDGSKLLAHIRDRFESIQTYKNLRVNDLNIVLFHFPIESWDRMQHGAIHLHGHLHGDDHHTCRVVANRLEVGVDCREEKDMAPFHLDEVMVLIKKRNDKMEELNEQWKPVTENRYGH